MYEVVVIRIFIDVNFFKNSVRVIVNKIYQDHFAAKFKME